MWKRFLGQLRSLWDTARQLVELREEIEQEIEDIRAIIEKIDERTRKQDYRARQKEEPIAAGAPTPPQLRGSMTVAEARRIARERGLM